MKETIIKWAIATLMKLLDGGLLKTLEERILYYSDLDIPGSEKRDNVLNDVKVVYNSLRTHLISFALEVVYTHLKESGKV